MKKNLTFICLLLTIIGGFNWLLVGFFEVNLVYFILGGFPMLEKTVYGLVGLSALYSIRLFAMIKKD